MANDVDDKFYDRADAHIDLSNKQLAETGQGKVSASMMYATARFNAWISATGFATSEQMRAARTESVRYFVEQFQIMLEENFDDYVKNFDRYMTTTDLAPK
jgi:hypothetical protein